MPLLRQETLHRSGLVLGAAGCEDPEGARTVEFRETEDGFYGYPVIDGKFVTVYRPQGDVYKGEDTFYFRKNTYYGSWTANDFSILNDNGTWHLVGITHPTPPDYVDEFTKISGNLHR